MKPIAILDPDPETNLLRRKFQALGIPSEVLLASERDYDESRFCGTIFSGRNYTVPIGPEAFPLPQNLNSLKHPILFIASALRAIIRSRRGSLGNEPGEAWSRSIEVLLWREELIFTGLKEFVPVFKTRWAPISGRSSLPKGFRTIARTEVPAQRDIVGVAHHDKPWYGFQFTLDHRDNYYSGGGGKRSKEREEGMADPPVENTDLHTELGLYGSEKEPLPGPGQVILLNFIRECAASCPESPNAEESEALTGSSANRPMKVAIRAASL